MSQHVKAIEPPSLPAWVSTLPTMTADSSRDLPAGVTRQMAAELAGGLAAMLAPASPRELAVVLDGLFEWGRAFNVRCDRPALAAHYGRALAGHPAWALDQAIAAALAEATFPRFPLAREILDRLPARYRQLGIAHFRLRMAARYGVEAVPYQERADPAAVRAALAPVQASLRGGGRAAPPARPAADRAAETSPHRRVLRELEGWKLVPRDAPADAEVS